METKKQRSNLDAISSTTTNLGVFGIGITPWLTDWHIALKILLTCIYFIFWAQIIDYYAKNKLKDISKEEDAEP